MAGAKPAGFNLGYQIVEVVHARGAIMPMLIPGQVMERKKIVVVDPSLDRPEAPAGGKFLEFLDMVLIRIFRMDGFPFPETERVALNVGRLIPPADKMHLYTAFLFIIAGLVPEGACVEVPVLASRKGPPIAGFPFPSRCLPLEAFGRQAMRCKPWACHWSQLEPS